MSAPLSPPPQTREELARFLAHTSHELRTPLNGIIGGLELLKETALNTEQTHYSHLIRTCTVELLALTEHLASVANVLMQNPPEPLIPSLDSLHVLNPGQLDELRDESLLEHLVELFRNTVTATLGEMRLALEQCDTRLLSTKAHLIKGSAANFGAERLVTICQTLESKAETCTPDELQKLLEKIREEYHRVDILLGDTSS